MPPNQIPTFTSYSLAFSLRLSTRYARSISHAPSTAGSTLRRMGPAPLRLTSTVTSRQQTSVGESFLIQAPEFYRDSLPETGLSRPTGSGRLQSASRGTEASETGIWISLHFWRL